MRLFSWNVNGIRAVINKGEFAKFIEANDPDILCLQETKAKQEQAVIDLTQYSEYWSSAEKAGYSFMPERVFEDYVFMPKGAEDCRTHYLHFAAVDSSEWQHVIRFRDALRRDQKLRDEYAGLKRHLSETHQNRAEYTQAKTAFIEKALEAK